VGASIIVVVVVVVVVVIFIVIIIVVAVLPGPALNFSNPKLELPWRERRSLQHY
jgi:hypothetical protein